ncbi:MAG: lipopolysaccharide biosynthesis protein [Ruminococcus sp.]|nr:lipopolysaccharide biosynthesis protein [Ruminococcus sp.]
MSKKVLSNFIWRFLERSGAQLVQFLVSIVLARILMPKQYGIVALLTAFIMILSIFIDSGLSSALIQKKDADEKDFSTVFFVNLALCVTLYIVLFFTAPFIAGLYHNPDMTIYLRVIGLTLIIAGVKNVQMAYVSRNLIFKRFFFATLGGTVGAGILGIIMAYMGFGVWALIAQYLFNNAVDTLILWLTVKWRPKKLFSFKRLKGLFSYGWKLLASSLIDTLYNNIRTLLIGGKYSSKDLAFYDRGNQFPNVIVNNINLSIDSVLLPTMSNVQDDKARVKTMTRRSIRTSTYLIAPLLMGLAFTAIPLIRLVLTEKWLPAVLFLRIFCVTYLFYPIHTANLNAIKAVGRSDMFLKLEIIKKAIGITALFATLWISVEAMAYSMLFTTVASIIINVWPNRKLLGYTYIELIKDILPGVLMSVAMGLIIFPIQFIGLPDIVTLCIQIPLGAAVYIIGSKLFKLESFGYLLGILKSFFRKKEEN